MFQVGNHYIHLVDAHPERIDKKLRANADLLNWGGITFLTPLNDIDKFEKNNLNVSVNVAGFTEKKTKQTKKKQKKNRRSL